MTVNCTWVGCYREANYPQKSQDGRIWANLCQEHKDKLDKDTDPGSLDVRACLSSWVKAGGGAKKMAESMQ